MDIIVNAGPPRPIDWVNYFDLAWGGRARIFERYIDEGETGLPRLLSLFERFSERHSLIVATEGGQFTGDVAFRPVAPHPDGWGIDLLEGCREAVLRGRSVEMPKVVRYRLSEAVAEWAQDCDAVVELGAGYGLQLFRTFYDGGPRNAKYIACEPTASGRDLAARLAAMEPSISFETRDFSFSAPDFSFLDGYRRVLLFTAWSLMYQPHLPRDFFRALASAKAEVTAVFFEPVGYQMSSSDERSSDQGKLLLAGGLSRDFYDRFTEASAEGLIEPLCVVKDVFADSTDAHALISALACAVIGSE